jgi:hypothetical protein
MPRDSYILTRTSGQLLDGVRQFRVKIDQPSGGSSWPIEQDRIAKLCPAPPNPLETPSPHPAVSNLRTLLPTGAGETSELQNSLYRLQGKTRRN